MRAFFDNLRLSLGTFLGNPLRSLLTLLGIVIGVATVIAMMGLIEGFRLKMNRDLSQLGASTFQVTKFPSGFGRFNWAKYAKRPNLTLEDVRAISLAPSVGMVSAVDEEGGQKVTTAARETRPAVTVTGTTPAYLETSGITVESGRFFGETESVDGRSVAVLGVDVADTLFPNMNPLGYEVRIRGRAFTVIGVLQRRGSFMGMVSLDNQVIVPLAPYQMLYGKNHSLDINVQAREPKLLDKAQDEVGVLLRRRRNLAPLAPNDFEVNTNESMTKTFNQLSGVVTAASFGVCLLALVVGGIGILNIMLVSVTERTREIGIRKALGARKGRILGQFATEAVILALVGGVIGVAIGFLGAFLVRWLLRFETVVPTWAVLLSLGMSSGVGLLFGIYPAARAARLDPVDAMRHD
ncbi:ABC transporter permease [Aggregicoccus sp. 17bor-14]|uniref:ABC transporter permease n=1 Tax=Myxococcaceae TaxID=31 RepID=UPI00129C396C|nr:MULTISPECIES: ABC transporter permease [Myxococcaceae]MBF5044121.1 ABC transporter permease [Simulacricoccus sp. 17bor-14]MRI89871.1 ABC transporter permease [Aggregicoccus sp. 17bor-14]